MRVSLEVSLNAQNPLYGVTTVRNHDILGKLATNSMGDHQILISHKDTTRMEASGMDNIMYKHIYLMVKPLLTRSLAVKRLSLANKTLAG